MATGVVTLVISAVDQASAALRQVTANFRSQLNSMEQAYDRFQKRLQVSANLNQASQAAQDFGMKAMNAFNAPLKAAADFEAQLSSIKAFTGASADVMARFQAEAMKAGSDTQFSALEAAKGIEELAKAGIATKDILGGGLTAALNLATAGEVSVAEAAGIAATALNTFSRDSLSIEAAGNILAGAAGASFTNVRELQMGLSAVGTVAAGAGMSFKDVNTALAVFAQNGLKGSDAGTSFKTMLMNLQPNTKEQAKLFDELRLYNEKGGSAFYDLQGNLKSFSEIAALVQDRLKGMSAEQQQAALRTLFGTDAIRAGNILLKEGAAGVEKMAAEMEKFNIAGVAAEKLNNLWGATEMLKGTVETLFIQLLTPVLPVLRAIVEDTDKLVKSFSEWAAQNSELVTGGFLLIRQVGVAALGFGALLAGASAITAAFGALGLMISPLGIALGALGAAGYFLYQNWQPALEIVKGFYHGLLDGLAPAAAALEPLLQLLRDAAGWFLSLFEPVDASSSALGEFYDHALAAGQAVGSALAGAIAWASQAIQSLAQTISASLGGFDWRASGLALVQTLADGVAAGAKWLWDSILGVFEYVAALFPHSDAQAGPFATLTAIGMAIIRTIALGVKIAAGMLWQALVNAFTIAGIEMKIAGNDLMQSLSDGMDSGAAWVQQAFNNALTWLQQIDFDSVLSGIAAAAREAGAWIAEAFRFAAPALGTVRDSFVTLWNSIVALGNSIAPMGGILVDAFSSPTPWSQFFGEILQNIVLSIGFLAESLATGINYLREFGRWLGETAAWFASLSTEAQILAAIVSGVVVAAVAGLGMKLLSNRGPMEQMLSLMKKMANRDLCPPDCDGDKKVGMWTRLKDAVASAASAIIGRVRAMTAAIVSFIASQTAWAAAQLRILATAAAGAIRPVMAAMQSIGMLVVQSLGVAFAWLGAAFTAFKTMALTGLTAIRVALLANPVGALITAVVLLATAAYLIYENWEPIKAFFADLWDGIVSYFTSINWGEVSMVAVSMLAAGLSSGAGLLFSGVQSLFGMAWDYLKSISWGDVGMSIISTLAAGVSSVAGLLWDAVVGIFEWVASLLPHSDAQAGPFSTLTASGMAIVQTLASAILSVPGLLIDAFVTLFTLAKDTILQTDWIGVGVSIINALIAGVASMAGALKDAILGMVPSPGEIAAKVTSAAGTARVGLGDMIARATGLEDSTAAATAPTTGALKRASGGLIAGPGSGTSDSIPLWASNGEYVMSADAVKAFGVDAMKNINNGKMPAMPLTVPIKTPVPVMPDVNGLISGIFEDLAGKILPAGGLQGMMSGLLQKALPGLPQMQAMAGDFLQSLLPDTSGLAGMADKLLPGAGGFLQKLLPGGGLGDGLGSVPGFAGGMLPVPGLPAATPLPSMPQGPAGGGGGMTINVGGITINAQGGGKEGAFDPTQIGEEIRKQLEHVARENLRASMYDYA